MAKLGIGLNQRVIRAFVGTMAVSVAAKFTQLLMAILLARQLGPEDYGLVTFVIGLGLVGGRVGGLGWPVMMVRFIPHYSAKKQWSTLKGLLRTANWVVLVSGVIFGFIVYSGAKQLGTEHRLFEGLVLSAMLLPVMSLRSLARNKLIGYKASAQGIFVDEFLPSALVCLVLITPMLNKAQEVVILYVASSGVSVGIAAYFIQQLSPKELLVIPQKRFLVMWMSVALPALVGLSARLLMNKADVIMIAPLSTFADVGLYGAAFRITYVQTFFVVVLAAILGPRISEALTTDSLRRVKKLFWSGLLFSISLSGVLGAMLMIWSEELMYNLFGVDYVGAAPTLVVLAFGQVFGGLGILTSNFLLVSGREKIFGIMTFLALSLNIGANYILIPLYGGLGAAYATSIAIVTLTASQLVVCLGELARRQ